MDRPSAKSANPQVTSSHLNAMALRRPALCASLACWILLIEPDHATAVVSCKPILATRVTWDTRVSPMQPYLWKAAMFADVRHCATHAGTFEVDFVRIKEYAPELQFTEQYRWTEGEFEIALELSGDEAVVDHRIGFVAPCVCRDPPFG